MICANVCINDDTTIISVGDANGDNIEWVVPCGMSSLHRRHFTADPPLPEDLTNAIGEMIDHLDDARRELPLLEHVDVVVLSGTTARVVASVEHGGNIATSSFSLSRDAAEDVFRTLATESAADRRHNPGLPAQLCDTIVGGCCAVVAVFRGLQLTAVTVALHNQTGEIGL